MRKLQPFKKIDKSFDYITNEDTIKRAIDDCDIILSEIDDLPEAAAGFSESVENMIGSMREYIVSRNRVSKKQLDSILNTKFGMSKWMNNNYRDYYR